MWGRWKSVFRMFVIGIVMGRWKAGLSNSAGPLWGPATLSWWRGLVPVRIRTWQGSQEPASQGSPLRVVQGSHRIWEEIHELSTRTPPHRVRLHDLGAAMRTLAGAGVDAALSPWLRGWWSPQNHHTDHLATGSVCLDCVLVRKEEWAVVYWEVGEKFMRNCSVRTYIRWRSRCTTRMCWTDSECIQHSSIHKSEASVLTDLTTKSAKTLVVEPPATVWFGSLLSCFSWCFLGLSSLRWSCARWSRGWSNDEPGTTPATTHSGVIGVRTRGCAATACRVAPWPCATKSFSDQSEVYYSPGNQFERFRGFFGIN